MYLLVMMVSTLELDMLPAQIPLTLEHLFPILSNSNAKDRAGGPFFYVDQGRSRKVRSDK